MSERIWQSTMEVEMKIDARN